jgi:flagellar protein FlbD
MINVTSLNGENKFFLNIDKIEIVEANPDTMISLESGRKYLVSESADDIVKLIEDTKRRLRGFAADL